MWYKINIHLISYGLQRTVNTSRFSDAVVSPCLLIWSDRFSLDNSTKLLYAFLISPCVLQVPPLSISSFNDSTPIQQLSSCSKSFLKNYKASGILYGKKYSNKMPPLLHVFASSGIRRATIFLCLVWQPRSLNFWLSDILSGIPLAASSDDVLQASGMANLPWDPFIGKTISTKIHPEAHMSPNNGKHHTGNGNPPPSLFGNDSENSNSRAHRN